MKLLFINPPIYRREICGQVLQFDYSFDLFYISAE